METLPTAPISPEEARMIAETRAVFRQNLQERGKQERDVARREGIKPVCEIATALDQELLDLLPEGSKERQDLALRLRILREGEQIEAPKQVTEKGANAITRRTYKVGYLDRTIRAYVKGRLGTTTLRLSNGKVFKGSSVWDRTSQRARRDEERTEESTEVAYATSQAGVRREISRRYDISMDQVPILEEEFGATPTTHPDDFPKSSYTVSRINETLGLKRVPLTVLRPLYDHEEDGPSKSAAVDKKTKPIDLGLVQEEVKNADGTKPEEFLEEAMLAVKRTLEGAEDSADPEIRQAVYEEPEIAALAECAVMAELCQLRDQRGENIVGGQCIDNDDSFPLAQKDQNGKAIHTPIVSYPLELMQRFKDWKIPKGTITKLKSLRDELAAGRGQRAEYMKKLFDFRFSHGKIADVEFQEFKARLDYLVIHHRPRSADTPGRLVNAMQFYWQTSLDKT